MTCIMMIFIIMVNIIMFPLISDGLIPNSYLISGKTLINLDKMFRGINWVEKICSLQFTNS